MHLLILWFRFTSQMAQLSNINFYFDCNTRLCLIVPGRQENIFLHKKVSFYKVYSMISMNRTHLLLTVNTNT